VSKKVWQAIGLVLVVGGLVAWAWILVAELGKP